MAVIVIFALQCKKDKAKPSSENQIKNQAYTVLADSFFVPLEVAEIYASHMNAADTSYHGELEREIETEYPILDENEIPCMWVFNYADSGWLILSADYRCEPIMAFDAHGGFTPDSIPGGLGMWIDASIESINMLRSGDYDNITQGVYAWNTEQTSNNLAISLIGKPILPRIAESSPPCSGITTQIKGPLLNATWGQDATYNNNTGTCTTGVVVTHKLAGCVAVAVGQVLHYFHKTGCCTGYNYSSMPANHGNAYLSGFLKEVGDRVNMNYGCDKSGAQWNDYKNVFTVWYDYSNSDHGDYNSSTVISNILSNKPVILTGYLVQTATNKKWWQFWKPKYNYEHGHTWVCDGVTSKNNCGVFTYELFDMNWGWHEVDATTLAQSGDDYNGWFRCTNWYISGNDRNYKYANQMVYNLIP